MPRYLDPKNDLVFKKIFGQHPELLKSFLNAILPLPEECVIEDLVYLPSENVPEIAALKYSIVDVRCRDNHGRHFIVEMELQWTADFIKRMVFNTASAYVRQLKSGQNYQDLKVVYRVAIIDARFSEQQEWFHHYRMAHAKDSSRELEDIQLVLIELPNFKPTSIVEKKLAILWLRFLSEINERTENVDPMLLEAEPIKTALHLLERASYNESELLAYDQCWNAVSSEKTLLSGRFSEGLAEGKAEGKAEGLAEGKAAGLAEGEAKIVQKLQHSGMDVNQICQLLELKEDDVRKLLESSKS